VRNRVLAGSLLTFLLLTGVALAGSPKPGQLYTSEYLTVTVGKPAKAVKVFVECLAPTGHTSATWTGEIPLKHGSFKIDRKEKLSKLPKGKFEGTVDITGTFKSGAFEGTWLLGGASCLKTTYKATTEAGGRGN
jgi:hypothetical protein